MPDEGNRALSDASDDDALMRAIARAPSRRDSAAGEGEADPVRVAHFKIGGRLGSGGMGVVFRAQDESLRREVAIKLLPTVSAGDPERRQRFLREARVAASLVHPNVAVVYQVGEADGRVYIAMELVDGVTLRKPLDKGALPVAKVRDVALQVAQGLAAAHAKGVVHRDLKPENVMVTGGGAVKLLDFGLAKSGWVSDSDSAMANADTEAQITREGEVLGSSAYMSPEQALGMSVDARSDVFSFGIMVYEMLCGRRPFLGRTLGEIRGAIAREPFVPIDSGVDPGLAALVRKCLEKRADDRYADAGVVVLELAALAGASERTTRGAATTDPPALPASRTGNGAKWAIGGVTLVAVAVLLVARGRGAASAPAAPSSNAMVADPADETIDDGANKSSSPVAQQLYESALAAEQNTSCEAAAGFLKRAFEADPSFAGAALRLYGIGQDGASAYFHQAVALEPSMSPRDKELMGVVTVLRTGGDRPAAIASAEKYLARYPRDVWMWNALIGLRDDGTSGDAGTSPFQSVIDRAIEKNPASVVLAGWKANELLDEGKVTAARETAERCLAGHPRGMECLWARANAERRLGACQDFETDARQRFQLAPSSAIARQSFADALASNGATTEAVRDALGPAREAEDGRDLSRLYLLPLYEGDFVEAARIADEQAKSVSASPDANDHFKPAWQTITADLESGDVAAAARVARDFRARSSAWGAGTSWSPSSSAFEADMLNVIEAGGEMSHAEAAARRSAIYALAKGKGESPIEAWAAAYADPKTKEEARDALDAFDGAGLSPADYALHWTGAPLAEAFARAERPADGERGRPVLEAIARQCILLTRVRRVLLAELALGRLDEAKGDTPAACAHYAKVVGRWGHAKPRSVMAEEARGHATKLGCAL